MTDTDIPDAPPSGVNGVEEENDANGINGQSATAAATAVDSFVVMGLDSRLSRALGTLNYSKPTLVQSRAIPLGLDRKDVVGSLLYSFFESL